MGRRWLARVRPIAENSGVRWKCIKLSALRDDCRRRSQMARLVHVVSFCIALLLAPACFAQSWPADLTVVSVLTMAKDLAETEPAKGYRLLLKERVARAIRATGQEAAFHSYLA